MDGMWWLDVWRIPTAAGGHHHLFKWLLKMKCVDTGSVLGFEQQGASPQGTETRLYWIVSFHFLLVCCCCCCFFFLFPSFQLAPLGTIDLFSLSRHAAPLFRLLGLIRTHWNANVFPSHLHFASFFFCCCLIKSRPFCYTELQLLPCVTYTHTHTHIAWHPQFEATPAALSILVSSMLPFPWRSFVLRAAVAFFMFLAFYSVNQAAFCSIKARTVH